METASLQGVREGLVLYLMEKGKRAGVLAFMSKGKYNIVFGVNGMPYRTKRPSGDSLRHLVGEVPPDIQAVVRDYAATAQSTSTQDEHGNEFILRAICLPKDQVVGIQNTHCLSLDDVAKVHEIQAPNASIIRRVLGII